jgi:hypothetical protein
MKTQQEIVIQAKAYAESIGDKDGTSAYDYVMGYNKCQEDMAIEIAELKIICQEYSKDIKALNRLLNSLSKQD